MSEIDKDKERVKELTDLLNKYSYQYYVLNQSDIPDSELTLIDNFFTKEESDRFYEKLLRKTKWREYEMEIYDKTYTVPRMISWYEDKDNFPCLIVNIWDGTSMVWVHYADFGVAYDFVNNKYKLENSNWRRATPEEILKLSNFKV